MSDQPAVRKTVLHSRHLALGAAPGLFGGWEMPLWYRAGAVREHLAVIRSVGLFDTSHMDLLIARGDARAFLDYAFTRDLSGAKPGRALYGAFLDSRGCCMDDGVLYPFADGRFGIVVNAGMGPIIRDHLAALPGADKAPVAMPPVRPAKIDVQGPGSPVLIKQLFAPEKAAELFRSFPFFSFRGDFDFNRSDLVLADGTPALLSRSGYTGELGFELFVPLEAAGAVWDRLLELGGAAGALPCGLAARDSLRTGAVLPLSHQDIGPWPYINHPWHMALPFDKAGGFSKIFIGSDHLHSAGNPFTLPFVGFDPRRVDAHCGRVKAEGREVGTILTIVTDVAIGRLDNEVKSVSSPGLPDGWQPRGLACGFVKVAESLPVGAEITLADGRREIRALITADIRPDRTARKKL